MRFISQADLTEIIRTPQLVPPLLIGNIRYSSNILLVEDCLISDITIIGGATAISQIVFKNVIFTSLTIQLTAPISQGLLVEFELCKFDQLRLDDSKEVSVRLKNILSMPELSIYGNFRRIEIDSSSELEIEEIRIESYKSENFKREKSPSLRFYGRGNTKNLKVKKVIVIDSPVAIFVDSSEIGSLNCECIDGNSLIVEEGSIVGFVNLVNFSNRCTFLKSRIGSVDLAGGPSEGQIEIVKSEVAVLHLYDKLRLDRLTIYDNSKLGAIIFEEGYIGSFYLTAGLVDLIDIKADDFIFDSFTIDDSQNTVKINQITFREGILRKGPTRDKSTIRLANFSIARIWFHNFTNQGDLYVAGLTSHSVGDFHMMPWDKNGSIKQNIKILEDSSPSLFKLSNSDLGKITFIACDFSKMVMSISGSKINEIYLTGTEMPFKLEGNYRERQIGYYQLKKLFDGMGDGIQTAKYQSLELAAHLETLEERRANIALFSAEWLELITLRANNWSNEFGSNWGRSLWLIVLSTVILFTAYAHSLGYIFTTDWTDEMHWHNFHEIGKFVFDFALPTHRTDFATTPLDIDSNALSTFIDTVARILNGYLFYQLIQAFRKYGKK